MTLGKMASALSLGFLTGKNDYSNDHYFSRINDHYSVPALQSERENVREMSDPPQNLTLDVQVLPAELVFLKN